ncbi:phage holin family protein [Planctomycetes bacterium K23_9]|uniref:Uncharacterized protein n=1 Tax=Stieleria marina TaxID=1930275 RepID=A0A517NXU0_9BACT|nr:hypothetical protein K239x_39500 [Planctomycetes bacterium K23_9]
MENTSSFQRVARDVLDLCELQIQLLSVDSQAAKRKLTTSVICGLAAVTVAGSALTTALVGGGLLLGQMTPLSAGGGLLVASMIVFAGVIALLLIALSAIKSAASAMAETKSEFSENLRWLKATLISPATSPRNQMRSDDFRSSESAAASHPVASNERFVTPIPNEPSTSFSQR